MTQPVCIERRGHVPIVVPNRPQRRNAINGALSRDPAAMEEPDADPAARLAPPLTARQSVRIDPGEEVLRCPRAAATCSN
jgi:hypothetical protein